MTDENWLLRFPNIVVDKKQPDETWLTWGKGVILSVSATKLTNQNVRSDRRRMTCSHFSNESPMNAVVDVISSDKTSLRLAGGFEGCSIRLFHWWFTSHVNKDCQAETGIVNIEIIGTIKHTELSGIATLVRTDLNLWRDGRFPQRTRPYYGLQESSWLGSPRHQWEGASLFLSW